MSVVGGSEKFRVTSYSDPARGKEREKTSTQEARHWNQPQETVTHVRLSAGWWVSTRGGKAYVGYTIGHAFRCFTFPRS